MLLFDCRVFVIQRYIRQGIDRLLLERLARALFMCPGNWLLGLMLVNRMFFELGAQRLHLLPELVGLGRGGALVSRLRFFWRGFGQRPLFLRGRVWRDFPLILHRLGGVSVSGRNRLARE